MLCRECFGSIGKADRNNEPVLRELIIAPMYLEGRNPLRPPIRAHVGIGYSAAPKDWRRPASFDPDPESSLKISSFLRRTI